MQNNLDRQTQTNILSNRINMWLSSLNIHFTTDEQLNHMYEKHTCCYHGTILFQFVQLQNQFQTFRTAESILEYHALMIQECTTTVKIINIPLQLQNMYREASHHFEQTEEGGITKQIHVKHKIKTNFTNQYIRNQQRLDLPGIQLDK